MKVIVPDIVQEDLARQEAVRAHWKQLGMVEVSRRGNLLMQAENLINKLLHIARKLPAFENEQRKRLIATTMKACNRSDRRAKYYYGQ